MSDLTAADDLRLAILAHSDPHALLAWLVAWRDRPGPHRAVAAVLLNYVDATLKEAARSLKAAEASYYGISDTSRAEFLGEG